MTVGVLKTKFGNAKICNSGYYRISSKKEGNHGKMLHRLIFEDHHNIEIPEDSIIHHKDGNKLNNDIDNLILMSRGEHSTLHHIGMKHSDETKKNFSKMRKGHLVSEETRKKISKANKGQKRTVNSKRLMSKNHYDCSGENNPMYGRRHSLEKKMEMSLDRNSSGYFRVNKQKSKKVEQGFLWRYQYYNEDGKRVSIASKDINELQRKVEEKGLIWKKL